ncbi:MAG TPA: M48 family metalloprotease [Gemmatimonadaceae bacterium]|nr:M48 family metalloprotease [Gemmatimonadaceae bacterium]
MIPIPTLGAEWLARAVVTLIAALVPALVAWWTDRRLLGKADDPALPELLASRRRTNVQLMAIGFTAVIFFSGADAAWGIPLLLALLVAAAYPLRTRLLGETWGFGSYLWHTTLSVAGGFGFWILLCYAPSIVSRLLDTFGRERWPIVAALAAVLAVALFAFEEWYPRIWLWSHAAEPLSDPVLTPRFEEIIARAGTVSPAIYRVGPQGSRFTNAVVLPSVRRPAVAMGKVLFELLEPDESTAIFAHEIAHFNQFTPKRVGRAQLVNRLLVVIGVAFPFSTTLAAGRELRWLTWVWPILVLSAVIRRAAKSQQRETESDLRAAALCGDPEALVRGLVKLHLHARIPRRYAVDVERAATHPSLVRRIQAIRAGGAAAVEQLGAAAVVRSTRAGSWVVLDADRSYWLDGVPEGVSGELTALREAASSYRAVSYGDLVELRVSAVGNARTLTSRARAGEAWSVPIAGDDVERIQRTLDVVDLRLGKAGPAPTVAVTRIVGLAALIAVLISGQVGVVLIPIALSLWRPSAAAFAALGAMSVMRAALGVVEGSSWFGEETARLGVVALAAIGAGAIFTAWRMARGGEQRQNVRVVIMTLGFSAIVVLAAVVQLAVRTPVSLAGQSLMGALGTLIVGIAAATFFVQARWNRIAAVGAVVAGIALATVGVDAKAWTLRNALTQTAATATLDSQMPLGVVAAGLRVTPDGEHFLATPMRTGRRPTSRQAATLLLGRFGGTVRELAAVAADFVDDERVLTLDALESGMELRIERVDSGAAVVWADTLTGVELVDPRLVIDRDSSSWAIIGESADDDQTSVYAGKIGVKGSAHRAGIPDTIAMVGDPIVFGQATTVIVPTYKATRRGAGASATWALPLMGINPRQSELWRVRGDDLVRVASLRGVPQCGAPANGVAACESRHMRATSLYAIDAAGVTTEVAQLASPTLGMVAVGPGLRAASMKLDRSIQVIDLAARRLTTVSLPAVTEYASEVRVTARYIVTLSYAENRRSTVRRYRLR